MFAGILWVILRILTSLCAAAFSALQKVTPSGEAQIPLWPIQAPLAAWMERALLEPLARWDVKWYLQIIIQGYRAADGTAQFHPLYPLLAVWLHRAGLDPLPSLLLVSSAAGLAGLLVYQKLAALDLSPQESQASLVLFGFFPLTFVLFIPYTEAVFLLCAALSLYAMRKKKWLLAGLMGALAVLTRQQGILLAIPLAWELWEESGRNLRQALKKLPFWLPLGLIPAAYAAWVFYRSICLNDFALTHFSPSDFIYTILVSQSAVHVVPFQILPPWQTLYLAGQKLIAAPDIDIWTNFVFGGTFLLLVWAAWRYLRASYRLYVLAVVLISFAYYTGPVHPLMGLIRHLWLAFPVFIGLARRIHAPWQRLLYAALGLAGMAYLIGLYIFEAWVI